jgi:putative FmdB family regulatory protein
MPTYTYESSDPHKACGYCREQFEATQKMSEEPLTACPKCGGPVQRVITAVGVVTRYAKIGKAPSDAELRSHGFHKLVNEGGGKFRKVV